MKTVKNVLSWCVLLFCLLVCSGIVLAGESEFPVWVELPAWIVLFIVVGRFTHANESRRLAAGDEALQKLTAAEREIATLKSERDWVVSYAVMYGSGRLLNVPSEAVIPTLNRLGKRLPSGNNRLQHQVVVVQTIGRRTLAYAVAARPGTTYSVLEDQLAYEISPIDFVPYASVELIDDWYRNGLLGELDPQYEELARQLSKQYTSSNTAADMLRDVITIDKIDTHVTAAATAT